MTFTMNRALEYYAKIRTYTRPFQFYTFDN